ncbi:SigE family RNA polymerase sigma factor [Micromonospora sp. NBC_01655]|uniref:SigE family RNA polymerase sigma factor n=1 Tax=Micromonospora sp. NBC_01655 TaxID=2975983 RepID=UPI00224DBD91|nr:SigE family RNA polymerase sigma factor [Micromonospora sp. NBC_01655]MCX4474510.1 SigE family RNA polymerase sigma factor [Micromonospora sp. NBC_01655]
MAGRDPLEEEFREFVAARSGALLRTAYLLAGDWATAEDLLQTALTKTYLACRRLGGIDAIEPYARRVMVNTSTSWWRRRWHGERPTEVLPERAGIDEIEQQLDRDVLWRHLRALPSRQRAVLVLRFYEDMSEAQTAALLEISPGTVKSQTSRALATLRRRLGEQAAIDLPDLPGSTRSVGREATTRRPSRAAGSDAPVPGRTAPRPGASRTPPRRPAPDAEPARVPAPASSRVPAEAQRAAGAPRRGGHPRDAGRLPAPTPPAADAVAADARPADAVGASARAVGAERR